MRINQEEVKRRFSYADGELFYKYSVANMKKGDVVGCRNGNYKITTVAYKSIYLHRLIFLYHHGYIPDYIDHIDGNGCNNDIKNLRACTNSQNLMNKTKTKANTSGIKGVSWSSRDKLWRAQLKVDGKSKSLGCFWDKETAGQVLKIERLNNHGEFSNNG
jgi:hypothetical protein